MSFDIFPVMQTTLRIDDDLYREAKAEAARQGTTLTRFLEEGLRLRLQGEAIQKPKPYSFPVFSSGVADSRTWEELKLMAEKDELIHYREKLGLQDDSP
jgi:hypothetical protein